MKSPAYRLTQLLVRAGFWAFIFWGVWMVVTHLWWNGHTFVWNTNPFGN